MFLIYNMFFCLLLSILLVMSLFIIYDLSILVDIKYANILLGSYNFILLIEK
jgi:hypothetical protein